ncbi:MAG: PadR family transcriptional regulator [Proteobacteria bacterium]|nr:PadR family transcriptional regulator [Pseudomonadota bacterium]
MSLRHAILGILEHEPQHGYAVKRVLEEQISGFWPVNLAAIYPCLRRLEEEGLVTHRTESTATGRPDRKIFSVTEAGSQELAHWRRLPPNWDEGKFRSPLMLKLLFARRDNLEDVCEWAGKAIEDARAAADQIRAELAGKPEDNTFFVRFLRESGLAHLELQAEMLTEMRDKIRASLEAEAAGDAENYPKD